MATDQVRDWLDQHRSSGGFGVERVRFADLDGWQRDPVTGDLVHRSGRFFSVCGLHVREEGPPWGDGPEREWWQPVIAQPEIGILGLLTKEFDGVLHLLMQAKMEPGNPNLVQLSPTVQATRSNYTGAHRGAAVRYVNHFVEPSGDDVLADSLQSEHGAWFHRKVNRNMVVETRDEVPLADNFVWLTLGQIGALLEDDDVVNMDSRTVLSCLPLDDGHARARLTDTRLLSWITGERARHHVTAERVALDSIRGWRRGESAIEHELGHYFRCVPVRVQAGNREVAQWSQPLFEPVDTGVVALFTRTFDGVPHYLVHARAEGGLNSVELAPTVQYTPANYAHLTPAERPPFLDLVMSADLSRVRYQAVHSEEGGRFLNASSDYLVIEADESQAPTLPPPGYAWVTLGQLSWLTRHANYLNVQARTLLACLRPTGPEAVTA